MEWEGHEMRGAQTGMGMEWEGQWVGEQSKGGGRVKGGQILDNQLVPFVLILSSCHLKQTSHKGSSSGSYLLCQAQLLPIFPVSN